MRQVIDGTEVATFLKDVVFAPMCRANVVALAKAQQAGVGVYLEPKSLKFVAKYKGRKVMVEEGHTTGVTELTSMKSVPSGNAVVTLFSLGKDNGMKLAHRRICFT